MGVVRVGVFALESSWRVAGTTEPVDFPSQQAALDAACKAGLVARWRGSTVEFLVQDHPGGELVRRDRMLEVTLKFRPVPAKGRQA